MYINTVRCNAACNCISIPGSNSSSRVFRSHTERYPEAPSYRDNPCPPSTGRVVGRRRRTHAAPASSAASPAAPLRRAAAEAAEAEAAAAVGRSTSWRSARSRPAALRRLHRALHRPHARRCLIHPTTAPSGSASTATTTTPTRALRCALSSTCAPRLRPATT